MIHDVSRRPPSEAAIAGVAVASSVWSTAAMHIGRNTAAKRLRNCARVTGDAAAGAPAAGRCPVATGDSMGETILPVRQRKARTIQRWPARSASSRAHAASLFLYAGVLDHLRHPG